MVNFLDAKKIISKSNSILIACHINPDGDTIGSMLALGLALEQLNKKVYMISADGVPKRYVKLPGADKVKEIFSNDDIDLAIAVDCGTKHILGNSFNYFEKAKAILEIDHHEIREDFGDFQLIDINAGATGEIIYFLLKELNVNVTKDIAEAILTSIIVETNSFRLPSVSSSIFQICADLTKLGVEFNELTEMVYWCETREKAVLSGLAISRCKFLKDGELVWSIIKRSDLKKVKGLDEDVDAVADDMRAIQGVKIVAFFREKKGGFLRVSLRSKGGINVAKIAGMYGGGGHCDVAGCSIPNKRGAIKKMLDDLMLLL
ncbi:bifunctional oligoribonuclease/PAP phosphatase NrnA [bacterium]|nr:bifunctional oligoribonuclease/PAP phosphatase NrnA [bacterium]